MIEKQHYKYILVCDVCGEDSEERFDRFLDAVDGRKDIGWKSQRDGTGWKDVCPGCQEVKED